MTFVKILKTTTIPDKIKVGNIKQSKILYFCFALFIYLQISSHFLQAMLTWSNSGLLIPSCTSIDTSTTQHCLREAEKMCYRGKHEFLKPAGFFAAKQYFLKNYAHTRTYSFTYFCPGLYFVEHLRQLPLFSAGNCNIVKKVTILTDL